MSFDYLLNDENEDEILARVQEESLRYYREVELPRISDESYGQSDVSKSPGKDGDTHKGCPVPTSSKSGIVAMDALVDTSVLCTQVGGKAGALLFEGDEAKGFHLAAGSTYIYPTNYPVRQYQANIVKSALFKNTLVSLPTGLGKTFIAAVVMYNFYRWYPRSKVVFMAPTRPLVAQQIKACYSIMGIPPDDTTEMTGVQGVDIREKMWKEKRVFFLTPQVMANDLKSNICPASLVKCIVIDEAHKAVKDYAYCQVVKLLAGADCIYRTLALSATPGNDINAVIQVIRNLNISCLEMRGEDSIDVAQYSHGKSIESVVVDLSPEVIRVRDDFMQVYEKFARSLIENRALTSNIAYLSKFQILKSMEKFRANPPRGMSTSLIGSLVSDFTLCMTFAHALELLQIYGLRAFYRYLADESGEKSKAATTRLRNNEDLQRMLKKLHDILYPKPGSDVPYTWGHPKLKTLVHSLSAHFKSAEEKGEKTKAIVFCQYKVVVNEIVDLLSQCKPHVQAALFIGQSGGKERGMPQSRQLQIMKDFREGKINCLVATSVAEEGLDVGEVDLIVLMESQKSPVRLVQRLGRTGRKRKGRCIVLLTRGKEEGKFHEAMASRKSYVRNIVESKAVKNSLCQYSPPMFPPDTKPVQQLVHIKVTSVQTPIKPVKAGKKQMDIRECAVPESRPFLNDVEAQKVIDELGGRSLAFDQLPTKVDLWHRRAGPTMSVDELLNGDVNCLSDWNDWNTEVHKPFIISNTISSETFAHLMSYNIDQEDADYLKLIDKYDDTGNIPLAKSRAVEPGKSDYAADSENEDNERKKGPKKKPAPKKNYGMDIRSCMAAVPKVHKRPRLDSTDDDVILVETDGDGLELELDPPGEPDAATSEKRHLPESRMDQDIAGIFGMGAEEFENALYSDNMLCGLESDIGMCLRLENIFKDVPWAPQPKCVPVDVIKFQCDQLLKLMDTVNVIPLNPSVEEPLSTNIRRTQQCESTAPVEAAVEVAVENDSFVDVDDLFGNDDVFDDLPENGSRDLGNSTKQGKPNTPNRHELVKNVGISPIHKSNESSVWGSNSVFAELSPIGKPPPRIDRPICSTPINPRKQDKEGCTATCQPENNQWVLDDILEEDEHVLASPSEDQSKKDLFAVTPSSNNLKVGTEPKSDEPKSDSDGDFWCLDDLFEDELSEGTQSKDPKNETSFYGITQMVSLIEKDKLRKKCTLDESGVQGVLPLTSTKQSEDDARLRTMLFEKTTERIPDQSIALEPSPQLTKQLPQELLKSPAIHILDSDDDSVEDPQPIIKKKETDFVRRTATSKAAQNAIPIVVIDSDSCSPPVLESQVNEVQPKDKSDNNASNLLDEDDDIFNLIGDVEPTKPTHKQSSHRPNVKKFKSKSLLSHLDFEPDNDFPPEKHDTPLDDTFNLRVGCSSKRKLSFEELLDERASKYFTPPDPKEPDKTLHKPSCSVPVLRTKPLQNSSFGSADDDVFVHPITGKSAEGVPLNETRKLPSPAISGATLPKAETSPSSSVSTSPVKIHRKKSKKRKAHAFIENEADESGIVSSDDSDNSSLDDMDDSFVNDESDNELSYAHYLKTVKSPVVGGKFKIPTNNRPYLGNVYSQVVNNADDDYENDSFCVDSDEAESVEESTILEQAERKLAKKTAVPPKKRIVRSDSGDSDSEERVADLNTMSVLRMPQQKHKRRLLESDSDVTPERPVAKRPRSVPSPLETEKTPEAAAAPRVSGFVVPKVTLKPNTGVIKVDSDSDEELKKAIRLSALESTTGRSAEEKKFEEDLQKALFLSQCEVPGPSKAVIPDDFPSPGDCGTSLLFTSQPILNKKPFSTNAKTKTTVRAKSSRKLFELSDSD